MGNSGQTADILIVDNDERIVELVAWFLAKRGHTVRSAFSLKEARVLLGERWPDLMLSDVDLGEESALEVLPRMQAAEELPPTLVVSGFLDSATIERLMALRSVVGTVAKPFDFTVLEENIRKGLREARALAERESSRPVTDGAAEVSAEVAAETPETPETAETAETAEAAEGWVEITPVAPPRPARVPTPAGSHRPAGAPVRP